MGVSGGCDSLVPDILSQLGVDEVSLSQLVVVGEGVEEPGEALQLDRHEPGLEGIQTSETQHTGPVHSRGRGVPDK